MGLGQAMGVVCNDDSVCSRICNTIGSEYVRWRVGLLSSYRKENGSAFIVVLLIIIRHR